MNRLTDRPGIGCFAALVAAGIAMTWVQSVTASDGVATEYTVSLPADQRTDITKATAAIQDVIERCATGGGGRVIVPSGTYLIAPLTMRSKVDLHLERNAILRFSRDFKDYPLLWIDDGSGREPGTQSPIYGENLADVSISGEGTIDGNGDAWRIVKKGKRATEQWDALVKSGGVTNAKGTEWYPNAMIRDGRSELDKSIKEHGTESVDVYAPYRPLLRPNLVRLVNCTNVRLQGVTFANSASWNVHLSLCDTVTVQNITIYNDISAQNGDGIDIDSCRNVTMTDSTVNAGDDAICLKSGKDAAGRLRARPTENVTITGCTIGTGHGGIVIGSEMSGGVRNVTVSDCTMNGTDNGLRFKSTRGRGGVVENINIHNVKMTKIGGIAVLFDLFYATKGNEQAEAPVASEETPQFRNFQLSDITCEGADQALQLRGLHEMPLRDMVLQNITINAKTAGIISEANGLVFKNVHIQAVDRKSVSVAGSAKISLDNCSGVGK